MLNHVGLSEKNKQVKNRTENMQCLWQCCHVDINVTVQILLFCVQ